MLSITMFTLPMLTVTMLTVTIFSLTVTMLTLKSYQTHLEPSCFTQTILYFLYVEAKIADKKI